MISYRALLIKVKGLERAQQCLGVNLSLIEDWALEILKKYPRGEVEIYEVSERVIKIIEGEKK